MWHTSPQILADINACWPGMAYESRLSLVHYRTLARIRSTYKSISERYICHQQISFLKPFVMHLVITSMSVLFLEVGVTMPKNSIIKYTLDKNQSLAASDWSYIRVGFTTTYKQGILLQITNENHDEFISIQINNNGKCFLTNFPQSILIYYLWQLILERNSNQNAWDWSALPVSLGQLLERRLAAETRLNS